MPDHDEGRLGWERVGVLKRGGPKAVQYEDVENMRVIHLVNAIYRGAPVHGTFELMEKTADDVLIINEKGLCVKVVTDWQSRRPKSRWRTFSLKNADYKIESSYHGKVVRRIID